jgi:hypothetical protein
VRTNRWRFKAATGLLRATRGVMPKHDWADLGRAQRGSDKDRVQVRHNIGILGYFAAPQTHVVHELTDPLLAPLPANIPVDWRVGLLDRNMPEG